MKAAVREMMACVERTQQQESELRGKAALSRLLGEQAHPPSSEPAGGPKVEAPLPSQGQTSPLIVNNIALPSGYPKVVKASTLSRRVAQIFLAPGRPMLRDPKEAAELEKHEKRYQDKALENEDVLFQLLGRMRQGSMLRACRHQRGTRTFFAVVKKILEVASSGSSGTQLPGFLTSSSKVYQILLRLLMDQRWGNCQWQPPPPELRCPPWRPSRKWICR